MASEFPLPSPLPVDALFVSELPFLEPMFALDFEPVVDFSASGDFWGFLSSSSRSFGDGFGEALGEAWGDALGLGSSSSSFLGE